MDLLALLDFVYDIRMNCQIEARAGGLMLEQMLLANQDWLILLARILLMALFLFTGWQKLTNFSTTIQYMTSIAVPVPTIAAVIAIVMELLVGAALILGVFTRQLALIFMAFTLGTALFGHHYWTLKLDDASRQENKINFYKNMSIMGGLLLLAITGPGKFALLS